MALSTHPAAAKWLVSTDITLRETYSDNVFLSGTTKQSDLTTQITPGIRIEGSGSRFNANLRYAPTALFYARNSGEDRIANNLSAIGTLEALQKFFFIEANGIITQGFSNPVGPQPSDISTITPNRLETRTFGISPYVRSQFGRAFTYEVRNRNTWTSTDNNALANIHARRWSANAVSPVSRFGWGAEYDQSQISYTTVERPDYRSKLFRGRLIFQPWSELRLFATAGREQNNYVLQQERSYTLYGGGVLWKPGPRTSVDLEHERRFFGPYRLARFDHRTRLTAWALSYSRNASNTQQELLRLPPGDTGALLDSILRARIPDPVERQAAVEQFVRITGTPAFLANPLSFYTQQIFLQERAEASLGILGKRNSITFSAFRAKSTAISSGVSTDLSDAFTPGNRITQKGFGINVSHRITPFTSLAAGARRTLGRQEDPASLDSRNDFFSMSLSHTVSPKTTTFAGVSYTRFVTTPTTSPYGNTRSAFVGLNHRF